MTVPIVTTVLMPVLVLALVTALLPDGEPHTPFATRSATPTLAEPARPRPAVTTP